MYRIALILGDKVQHIGEYEVLPQFSPPLLTVDVSSYEDDIKDGYLYDDASGTFVEPEPIEHPEIPELPEPEPVETVEEKLARIEQQLEARQMQDLILLDVNMTIYEELLLMQDKLNNG